MKERGYEWESMHESHACATCGFRKLRKHYSTVHTYRKNDQGVEVKYSYRRKECNECRWKKQKGVKIKYLQPTTTNFNYL